MPKLTETFNDKKEVKAAPLHVVAPHEPLTGEVFNPPCESIPEGLVKEQKVNGSVIGPDHPLFAMSPGSDPDYLKVALVGTAPSSRDLAPYNDNTWSIWPCSPGNMNVVPRFDAWFEIHVTLLWPENTSYGVPYLNWLAEMSSRGCPVFMQDFLPYRTSCPKLNPVIFPFEKMLEEFGPYFFTSSFAWQIAYAISRGVKEIALFGIDMASRDEYILQRPGGQYFFMECKRRGVKIGAPPESDILQPPPPYGLFESTPYGRKICAREKELKDRITPLTNQLQSHQMNETYLKGALEDVDYTKNIWGGAQFYGMDWAAKYLGGGQTNG